MLTEGIYKYPQKNTFLTSPERINLSKLETAAKGVTAIEINFGCGKRPCRMCLLGAPGSVGSMSFEVIKRIHDAKSKVRPGQHIQHFFVGDPMYYEDGAYDYADVLKDALKKGLKVGFATHGWLPDEKLDRVAEKICELKLKYSDQLNLHFSVDPFGWIGHTPESYKQAVESNIKKFAGVPMDLLFYLIKPVTSKKDEDPKAAKLNDEMFTWAKQLKALSPEGHMKIEPMEIRTFVEGDRPSELDIMPNASPYGDFPEGILRINGDYLTFNEKEGSFPNFQFNICG